jgi:deoxyribonuclease V
MQTIRRHGWDLTPTEAIALQKELRGEIVVDRPVEVDAVRLIAGVDVSVKNNVSQAAVVVLTFPDLAPVETALARQPTPFPYVPGLLTFREGPVLEEAFAKLTSEPDVFLFDGIGYAHPRRIGIVSHMGLLLGRPTIGCGKTRLCGTHGPVPDVRGAWVPLVDHGETVGGVLRTRAHVAPVIASPGHLSDVPSSVELILRCCGKYRLPEPIRRAHNAAGAFEAAAA